MSQRLGPSVAAVLFVVATLLSLAAPPRLAAQTLSVYPDASPLTKPFKSSHATDFGLVNVMSGQTYFREILCTGQVTNCSSPTPQQFTGPLFSITVNFTTTSSGTGRVRLKVYKAGGVPADTGWYDVTVEALSANTDVTNNDNQDVALCANSCFGAVYAQSTVPYFSLGAPRHVTLVYHGDRSSLLPFVHADVAPATGAITASEYWLEAKVNNAFVPFLNESGGTRIRFWGSSQQVRLAGQFNAASYATGAHAMDIIVTAKYSDGSTEQKAFATRLLNVDERQSKIARGWSISGLQRIYVQGDSSVVITEGDGSAAYFAYSSGCSCYTSPSGDFSKLTSSGGIYTRAYPDSTKATFNSAGQLTRVADRFGNSSDFEYDGSGRLTKIYDPFRTYNGGANRSYIELIYGVSGLSQIKEPGPDGSPSGGRVTNVTVQADSTLTAIQDPDGISTTFGYDGSRRLSTVTDRRGGATTYNYDGSSGKLAFVDLPTVTLHDGSNARPRTSSSPWQTVSVPTGPTSGSPFAPTTTANVLGGATDPLGRQTSFTSNHWGQALRINEPLGQTTTITRTGVHPTQIQRPTGALDYLGFSGALLTSLTPAGHTLQNIRYGGWAQPDSLWGTGRVPQRRFIGANGRVDSIRIAGTDSLNVHFTYDTRGRVLTAKDAQGHITSYHYDLVFGNLDSTLAPGARFTKVTFDGSGRIQTQKSNDEPQRQVVYDVLNRVREVHDGVNPSPTLYTYDQLYLTRVQDPKGQVFRFDNNALGWVTREYDPADTLARYDSFGYDSAGNVKKWTNRRGQQIDYTYDALNRLLTKSGTNTTTDSFWYSSDGRKMAAGNSVSTDTVYLRADGWADSVITVIAGQKFTRIYRPNDVQQLDSVRVTNSAGITFAPRHYGWNRTTGTLDTISVNGQLTRFARDKDLLPLQTLWPSLTRTAQWTSIHRPGELSFSDPTVNTALFRRFSYDSRFNLRDRIQWEGANFRTKQAGYDGLRRLGNQGNNLYATSSCPWDVTSGYLCPLAFQQTLTYDAGGNRTDVANAAYATGNRVVSFGVYTFTHDLDGNIVEKDNTSTGENKDFEWSAEGRLTRVLVNGIERVRYDYNAAGLLVRRWTSGTLDRHLLWDQGHLLAELDGTATQRVGEYAYLPGADRPLALITGAQAIAAIRYAVQDEVGNVAGLLNGTAIDQQAAYDDWGVPTVTGSGDNRLLFKGLLWEGIYTGMYYVRARWYDPELGRFVSEDPRGISEGTNYYSFAGSDAVNGWDPTGQWKLRNFMKSVFKAVSIIAPIVAFNSILAGPGLTSAVKALGGAALGSAVGAGIERGIAKHSFWPAFWRNFGVSSLSLAIGGVYAGYHGQKFVAGERNLITGFVRLLPGNPEKPWGLTLGSGILFGAPTSSVLRGGLVKLGQHEFGHALQFLALSALGSGPIGMYSALGLAGFVGQLGGAGVVPFVGCLWEGLADLAGSLGAGTASCAGLQQ